MYPSSGDVHKTCAEDNEEIAGSNSFSLFGDQHLPYRTQHRPTLRQPHIKPHFPFYLSYYERTLDTSLRDLYSWASLPPT